VLFNEQTPASLIEAVKRFEATSRQYDSDFIRKYAESFDRKIFTRRFDSYVRECYAEFKASQKAQATGWAIEQSGEKTVIEEGLTQWSTPKMRTKP
jgi:hypothetical protein